MELGILPQTNGQQAAQVVQQQAQPQQQQQVRLIQFDRFLKIIQQTFLLQNGANGQQQLVLLQDQNQLRQTHQQTQPQQYQIIQVSVDHSIGNIVSLLLNTLIYLFSEMRIALLFNFNS